MIDLTIIIEALLALMSAVITAVIIPLIRSKLTNVKCERIYTWVKIAVAAAEQLYKGEHRGAEKKKFVLEFLNERGFTYDPAALNAMIEASVKELSIAQNFTAVNGNALPGDQGKNPSDIFRP